MKLRILLAGAVMGLGIPASALIAQKPAATPRDWDFIDLRWWPVFNIADVGIVVGLVVAFWPRP